MHAHQTHSVWASIGWGGMSAVAGALISHAGVRAGMAAYVLLTVPSLAAAWYLLAPARQPPSADSAAAAATADGGAAGASEAAPLLPAGTESSTPAASPERSPRRTPSSSTRPAAVEVPPSSPLSPALGADEAATTPRSTAALGSAQPPSGDGGGISLDGAIVHVQLRRAGSGGKTDGGKAKEPANQPAAAAATAAAPTSGHEAGSLGGLLARPDVITFLLRAAFIGFGLGCQVGLLC